MIIMIDADLIESVKTSSMEKDSTTVVHGKIKHYFRR